MLTIKCPEFSPDKEMSSSLVLQESFVLVDPCGGFCTKVRINHATTLFSVCVSQNATYRTKSDSEERFFPSPDVLGRKEMIFFSLVQMK